MTSLNGLNVVSDLAHAWADAWYHLPKVYDRPHIEEPFDFVFFQMSFSDTSLGFGGLAGQMITPATVFVGFREWGQDAVVFVGGRFAYPVAKDDPRHEEFWRQVERRNVFDPIEWFRTCEHRFPENSNLCLRCGRGINVAPSGGPTVESRRRPADTEAPTKDLRRPRK